MFTVIAYMSLLVSALSLWLAIKGAHQFYWISALGIYIFSFIAGFSYGQFTVGLTFVWLAVAIGYSLGRIKGKASYSLFTGIGVAIGIIMVVFVDDHWTFLPFWFLPESWFN
jgi:hypothetical protein